MKKRNDVVSIACIFGVYAVSAVMGAGCPIKFMTGISCAGCGMTRAWLSVFQLDFHEAFKYHPLFWIVPVVFLMIFFRKKINTRLYNVTAGICITLVLGAYVFRMLNAADTIVTFDTANGAIWKTIKFIVRRF